MNQGMFLTALLSYFVIVDPVGVSLTFAVLTDGKDGSYCRRFAAFLYGVQHDYEVRGVSA